MWCTPEQVVSVVQDSDGNVQFLRSVDSSGSFQTPLQQNGPTSMHQAQTFILPITMPGDKPGEAQQTVQIQVLNPNQIQQTPKFQNIPMQLPIQGFQQPAVLTVSVPQDGEMLSNHGLPEGVTVVAAIQPQDLQLFAQAPHQMHTHTNNATSIDPNLTLNDDNENRYVTLAFITFHCNAF